MKKKPKKLRKIKPVNLMTKDINFEDVIAFVVTAVLMVIIVGSVIASVLR